MNFFKKIIGLFKKQNFFVALNFNLFKTLEHFKKKMLDQKGNLLFFLEIILNAILKIINLYDFVLNNFVKAFILLAKKLEQQTKIVTSKTPKINFQTKTLKNYATTFLKTTQWAFTSSLQTTLKLKNVFINGKFWIKNFYLIAQKKCYAAVHFFAKLKHFLKGTMHIAFSKTSLYAGTTKTVFLKTIKKITFGLKLLVEKWTNLIDKTKIALSVLKNAIFVFLKKASYFFSKLKLILPKIKQGCFKATVFLKPKLKHFFNLSIKTTTILLSFLSIIITFFITKCSQALDLLTLMLQVVYLKTTSFFALLLEVLKNQALNSLKNIGLMLSHASSLTKKFTFQIYLKTLKIITLSSLKVKNSFYAIYKFTLFLANSIFYKISSAYFLITKTTKNLALATVQKILKLKVALQQILTFPAKYKKQSESEYNVVIQTSEKKSPSKINLFFSQAKSFLNKLKYILNPRNVSLPKVPAMGLPGFIKFDLLSCCKNLISNIKSKIALCFSIKFDQEKIPLGKRLFFTSSLFFIVITFLKSFGMITDANKIKFIKSTETSGLESTVDTSVLISGIYFKNESIVVDANIKFTIENGSESLDNIEDFTIENSLKIEKKLLGTYSNLKNSTMNYFVKFELPKNNVSKDIFPFAEKEIFFVLKNNSVLTQEMKYAIKLKDFDVNLNGLNTVLLHSKHVCQGKTTENSMITKHNLEYPAMAFLFSLKQKNHLSFFIILATILPLILLLLGLIIRLKTQAMLTLTFISSVGLFFLNIVLQKKFNLEQSTFSYYEQTLILSAFFLVISWVYFCIEIFERVIKSYIFEFGHKARNLIFAAGSISVILLSFSWMLPAFF